MDEGHRRSSDREYQRILRFIDGEGDDPGCIVRMDRIERLVKIVDARSRKNEGRLRVMFALAEGHPLIDKAIAAEVVKYVRDGEGRAKRMGIAAGFVGRQSTTIIMSLINAALLGWLIIHGVPLSAAPPAVH
jgi:hypothetical protein